MTKEQAIQTAKQFRKDADELLQRMKQHRHTLVANTDALGNECMDVVAQHIISVHDLESCIMRQGLVLKHIGTPDPYPNSKDPSNTIVEPTADGLKL